MFIDYVTLLLVNMASGLLLLSVFLFRYSETLPTKNWGIPFFLSGFIALTGGLHMSFTWPLPGSFNMLFGEMSILLGIIFVGLALSISKQWNPMPIGIYALLPGAVATLLGFRVMHLGMTQSPIMAGIGFILTGLGGVLLLPVFSLKASCILRTVASLVVFVAAAIWVLVGFGAYWGHMESLSEWQPATMKEVESD